jgi:protein TonB
MDSESKRLTKTRAATLIGIALVHGLIIIWVLSIKASTSAISTQAIQVLIVDKPPRLRAEEKLSALQMNELKPVLAPMAIPHVDIPAEPPPPQALASEETSESNVSMVASNGAPSISSDGSGTASNGEGDEITVAHRVQPLYSDASVRAGEQGYVVAGLLIDKHGRVRKVQLVQSSGFSRLDHSVMDALRQWTFTRKDGAPTSPAWTTFTYSFHLARSLAPDLSSVNLALLPYDPAFAEQIRAAAVPPGAQTRKPYGAAALRRLIAAIRTFESTDGRDIQIQLVTKFGAVRSIEFICMENQGLDVNAVNQISPTNSQQSDESQWELYRVTQKGGTSEWLIDVTRSGIIRTAQALICAPEQTCDWLPSTLNTEVRKATKLP